MKKSSLRAGFMTALSSSDEEEEETTPRLARAPAVDEDGIESQISRKRKNCSEGLSRLSLR